MFNPLGLLLSDQHVHGHAACKWVKSFICCYVIPCCYISPCYITAMTTIRHELMKAFNFWVTVVDLSVPQFWKAWLWTYIFDTLYTFLSRPSNECTRQKRRQLSRLQHGRSWSRPEVSIASGRRKAYFGYSFELTSKFKASWINYWRCEVFRLKGSSFWYIFSLTRPGPAWQATWVKA